ncbi:hypothetical protein MferCBS31731_001468 [Microsporum ferrugineum]
MAAVSGIRLHWIDGIAGDTVLDKAIPPPASHKTKKDANIGSWRAHLNALQDVLVEISIVENNISSALILEDDADWDIRIKSQLKDFALASRALTQPLSGKEQLAYADPSFHDPKKYIGMHKDVDMKELPDTVSPLHSPYGDNWDILWLGHCGVEFPGVATGDIARSLPQGRVVYRNDSTVPEHEYLVLASKDGELRNSYPPHTRVVHHAKTPVCSLGYGVSQKSARRLLYEFGVKKFDRPYDLMLRDACEGINDRAGNTCLTVQPQLFNHHRPAGNGSFHSDITKHEGEIFEKAFTEMIRWSTRLNLPKLIAEDTDFDDQFPDKN